MACLHVVRDWLRRTQGYRSNSKANRACAFYLHEAARLVETLHQRVHRWPIWYSESRGMMRFISAYGGIALADGLPDDRV